MRVVFPLQKKEETNEIIYPDDIGMFSNCRVVGDTVIAEYRGKKPLQEYIDDEMDQAKDEPSEVRARKVLADMDLKALDGTPLGRAVKALLIYHGLI